MYEELTDFLGELPQGEYGHWIMDHKNDGSPEHPIQMPFVLYSGLVRKFITEQTILGTTYVGEGILYKKRAIPITLR